LAIYARSDLASVSVSPAHGGCGASHVRPAPGGKPDKIWTLDCLQCSDHLRHDPHWSATLSEIPETHDEQKSREDFTKRGAADRDQVMALALAKIAGVDLPETLRFALTGNMPDTPVEAMLECPNGHPGKPGSKFCAQCGEAMQQPANATPPAAVLCPDGHPNAAAAKFCGECGTGMRPAAPARQAEGSTAGDTKVAGDAVTVVARGGDAPAAPQVPDPAPAATDDGESGEPDLTRLHWKSLERLCKDRGLDATGSKAALVARLSEPQPAGASA
jgi:hypothetical protein